MVAAVLHDFDELTLETIPQPEAREAGTVVVQIKACGFCASDYKAIKGIRRNVRFPAILGHEPSGVVAQVGSGVTHFKVGDEVICQPSGFCGFCEQCRVGNTHYCEHAFTTGGDGPDDVWPGAFAEYMLTRESCLYAKPESISFDAACLSEPLSGAWKGLIQYSQMALGDDVVIIGAGSMGLLCVLVAKAAGAARLIAVDPSPHAREMALTIGATYVVDPTAGDAKEKIYGIIPRGPDLVLEAAGPIEAVELMVALRRRGTKWNVFGITTPESFQLEGGLTHFLEGRMDASFGTTTLAMSKAIRLMRAGVIDVEPIITHHFPLAGIHEAMEVMAGSERTKVVIKP